MRGNGFLEGLLSAPLLHGPLVSPDGRRVAWSWSRVGPAADVFVASIDCSAEPSRLTETGDDTLVISWTPDGRAVVVGQDRDGDERTQLFRVRLDAPGVMEPLTEGSPNYFVRGGQMHPNGRWLFYGANLDPAVGVEIESTWILRQDLETDERRVLARPEKSAFVEPQLNAPGTHVVYHRSDEHSSSRQVWLVDAEGLDDREILNFGPRTKTEASWFPDGRRILFTAERGTYRGFGVYDIEDGSTRWLVDDPERDVEYAFGPPTGERIVAVQIVDAGVKAFLLDPLSGNETSPPAVEGNLIPLSPMDEGWVGLHYSARQPPDLLRYGENGAPRSLTGFWDRTELSPSDLAPAEDFRWRSVDGMDIQGWLYRAAGDAVGTVVLIHGGPTSHAEDRFNAQVQYFVSRGLHVLAPNYRGSTGFGLRFQESIKEDGWGGREQDDIRSGIEALIEAGISSPGRVGVTGTSYGGYSAWWQITHSPTRLVAAAAPICGMTDLVVDYESTRPDLRPYSEEMMGGSPQEVPDRYRERSPIHFLANIEGNLLIVQGEMDPNVTPENVTVVRQALDRLGIPYEVLLFGDEGHGISRPANLKVLYPRLADFFLGSFPA
jgi:dipeptidyl aminopeptidase/acylaminoacyl peptidase